MKKILFLLLFFVFGTMFGQDDLRAFRIYDNTGKEASFDVLINKALQNDVVFFGELHNNAVSHWLELKIAEQLYAKRGADLIIGAEMFETDNQLIIDEYLHDVISQRNFEDECRLWPNYKTDYKPIVEFAKQNSIPLIATNIPRRYANVVFKKDFAGLKDLSKQAKKYIAPLPIKFDAGLTCYKNMINGMAGMAQHASAKIAKAQAIKDATMAHFILKNWKKGKLFFHFNGSYHSDLHEGICWYLKEQKSGIKIMTITTVTQKNINKLDDENKKLADFIVVVPDDFTTTY